MTYQEAYNKLIKHAAEVEKWKQGMEIVTITCYACKGNGENLHVDIEDGYGEMKTCDLCNGKGEIKEPHPKYF